MYTEQDRKRLSNQKKEANVSSWILFALAILIFGVIIFWATNVGEIIFESSLLIAMLFAGYKTRQFGKSIEKCLDNIQGE